MGAIKNIAIFGVSKLIVQASPITHRRQATGTLGQVLVPTLIQAGFTVTAISRPESEKKCLRPEVITKFAEYDDIPALTAALEGQNAVVEAFNPAAAKYQSTIVRAAIAAGVSHLITPEFSSDTFNEHADELLIYEPKLKAQRELEQLVRESGGVMSWTAIIVGAWYDWGIQNGVFWINKSNRTITRFGSGEQRYAISRIGLVADTVVAVLGAPEKFQNRPAYFASHTVTTNQLISLAKEIGGNWEVFDVSVDGFVENGRQHWNKDTAKGVKDRMNTPAYAMLGTAALFDENNRYGGDFGHKLEPGWDEGDEALKDNLKKLFG